METQTKEFFEEETRCQNDEQQNEQNQDAWIQGKDTQSGNSFEEEINRLKTLLDAERARFNEEHQRANDLEKELHDAKLKIEKREFNENDVVECSEAKKGSNASDDIRYSELLMENKALQHQLRSSQDKEALLQREMEESTALYQEVLAKLQNDIVNLSEQVVTLQEELEMERTSNCKTNTNKKFFKILKDENTAQSTELKKAMALLRKTSAEKERHLQEELKKMNDSHQELNTNYQTSVRQAESFRKKLSDNEVAHAEVVKMNQTLIAVLEAEKEALHQQLCQQQKELEQVKDINLEMVQKYENDILGLKEEIETMEQEHRDERYRHAEVEIRNGKRAKFLHAEKNMLQKELDEVKRRLFLNEVKYKEELEASTAEIEHQIARNHKLSEDLKQNAEAKAAVPVKKPFLKKLRHALGLRKPEKWKRKQAAEENV
ncbi:myosin-3-like [Xiphophorus couchianus]|uniref:myosin-3-like n=1 Tax=Xiphophorus couchianus TaxID=32473 RepID=UPI001016F624|nr:myosin-3-like [Xiphophorus couchianus]